jgi:flagellar biosynthesis component FlhA
MLIDDTVIVAGFVTLIGTVGGLGIYIKLLHGQQMAAAAAALNECKENNKRCEDRSEQQQEQIDALIEQDYDKAKAKRATDHLPIIQLLGLVLVSMLSGCADARQDDRQQQTANSAATIYEAAVAIEQGVPAPLPLAAIKTSASAICTANGHPYPPAAPAAPTPKVAP